MSSPAPAAVPKTCNHCHTSPEKLLKCGKCKTVYYCNASCQKNDWESHKPLCKIQPKPTPKQNLQLPSELLRKKSWKDFITWNNCRPLEILPLQISQQLYDLQPQQEWTIYYTLNDSIGANYQREVVSYLRATETLVNRQNISPKEKQTELDLIAQLIAMGDNICHKSSQMGTADYHEAFMRTAVKDHFRITTEKFGQIDLPNIRFPFPVYKITVKMSESGTFVSANMTHRIRTFPIDLTTVPDINFGEYQQTITIVENPEELPASVFTTTESRFIDES